MSSRRWPAWHSIRNPHHECIIATYGYNLASSMSYDNRVLLKAHGPSYGVIPMSDKQALESWRLADVDGNPFPGAVHSAGLGGTITGRGADILVIDDYYKNRAEAESQTIRDKVQDGFGPDLFSRLAPAHAVVIVANRWKDTDLVGYLLAKCDPDHESYDPEMPVWEHFKYPAYDELTDTFLFEERFGRDWYTKQRAMLGTYAWSSQGMQEPIARGGNRFKTGDENIQFHSSLQEFPDIRYFRFWDVASSEKERGKSDPDYTVGALIGIEEKDGLIHIWLKDLKRIRAEAPERNELIHSTAIAEDAMVGIESVAGYKDTYDIIKKLLRGVRMVRKVTVSKDKTVRSEPLEAIFEAGNIHVIRAAWNNAFVTEFSGFPDGAHDDIVDAVTGGFHLAKKNAPVKMDFNRDAIGL